MEDQQSATLPISLPAGLAQHSDFTQLDWSGEMSDGMKMKVCGSRSECFLRRPDAVRAVVAVFTSCKCAITHSFQSKAKCQILSHVNE